MHQPVDWSVQAIKVQCDSPLDQRLQTIEPSETVERWLFISKPIKNLSLLNLSAFPLRFGYDRLIPRSFRGRLVFR